MTLKEQIDLERLPQHIAIIMDGNGRWAKEHGHPRLYGHQTAVESVRAVTESCARLGVKHLTLYTFSTENWNRPEQEVTGLMTLLGKTLKAEMKTLLDNKIRIRFLGDLGRLPVDRIQQIMMAMKATDNDYYMTLNIAMSYSGRWELTNAARRMAQAVKEGNLQPDDITEDTVQQYLVTADMPDPELLIRTGGEIRISNFLLWQSAYSELYFTDKYWPEFREEDLYEAILDYQHRERRFGKTSEQLTK